MKRTFWLFLIFSLINMCVIFSFSSQDGEASKKVSENIVDSVVDETVGKGEKTATKQQVEMVSKIVRKSAHIALYTTLGIFVFMTLKTSGRVGNILYIIIATLMICIIYAVSDEFHQHFIKGRDGNVIDVLIDTCGSALGIAVAYFICKRIKIWFVKS